MKLGDFNVKSPVAWGRGVLFFLVLSVLIGVALMVIGWLRGRAPGVGQFFWTPDALRPMQPQVAPGPVYRTYGV